MAIDFGSYVYRPHPLQQWNIGEGFSEIIRGNRERARLAQNESQYARTRGDTQSQFSANFAKQRSDDQFTKDNERFLKQQELIRQARLAAQSNRQADADALVPSIQALGGTATRSIGAGGLPEYVFEEGQRPTRPELDFPGARRSIYGQGGPSMSAPFQVPGFGADGERNPFEPPAIAGAAAAALPPPASASAPPAAADPGPPPGAAVDAPPGPARSVPPEGAVWLPPGVDPGPQPGAPAAPAAPTSAEADLAALNSVESEPAPMEQPGPNPYEAPAFSPYRIAIADVMRRNQEGLSPYLEGLVAASPTGLRERIGAYAGGVKALGLTPEDSINASQKTLEQLYGNYRGEVNARAAAGRAENSMEQRREDRAWAEARNVIDNDDLRATKRKLFQSNDAYSLLESAHNNPQSARDLIQSLYRMKNTGVMTDQDFKYASEGMLSLWGRIKDQTLNKLFKGRGGLNPTQIEEIRQLLEVGTKNLRTQMGAARDKLHEGYKASTTDGQRAGWERALRTFFDKEYLPAEFQDSGNPGALPTEEEFRSQNPGVEVEGEEEPHLDSDPTSGPPPLGENLGVAPLPAQPRMPKEPNRAGAARGKNVLAKPPRGRPRTPEEVDKLIEEAERELNAP